MSAHFYTGAQFGPALARALGLDPNKVAADFFLSTGKDEVLSVNLTVFLDPADMRKIADYMIEEKAKP